MKLLIATGLSLPDMGGPATYTAFLEKHLPQHDITSCVVSFRDVRKYPRGIRHLVYTFRLIKCVRGCAVIYALDTVSVGIPAFFASVLTHTPLLLRVPGDYAWEQGQQRFGVTETLDEYLVAKKRSLMVRALSWLQYRVAQHALHIIVPSDYMKNVVASWGIDSQKITRIYSALKVIDAVETKEHLRAELGYRGCVLVTAARLVPWKGVRALIAVVAQLRVSGMDVSLEIIGDGSERSALEAYAHEQGVVSFVRFRGVLKREEMARCIKAGDIFVLNTSYEGLSHQLLEVMHLGTPIVTTPVGGNVELITDHVDGILVPFNDEHRLMDAVRELAADSELTTALVVHAQTRSAYFHEDRVIRKFVECIQSIGI